MIITKVQIEGYKSVEQKLALHPGRLTCLIGANEHGKTNVLEALNLLDGGDFDAFDRHLEADPEEAPNIEFELELTSDAERKDLRQALDLEIGVLEGLSNASEFVDDIKAYRKASVRLKDKLTVDITLNVQPDSSRRLTIDGADTDLAESGPLEEWFTKAVPTAQMFEASADLVDSISLQELQGKKNLPFVGLLKLAAAWDDVESLFTGDNSAHRLLQKAGKTLTRRVRKIWSQGAEHTFRFDESGGRLHIGIEDPTTYDKPSRRSLGFRSFFSFYLALYAETDEVDPEGFVLLFDEPGIHLHPKGQKDLLRELRRLSVRNQIVYSTHSPFMIDRNDPAAAVLVQKGLRQPQRGTRLVTRPYGQNWAAVQGALGITASDSFFPADRVLLVEGRSDKLYIGKYMTLCQKGTGADLNFLTVMDAEVREQVEDYVRMLLANDREIVVLADADRGGDQLSVSLKRLAGRKKDLLKFLDLRSFLDSKKEVSIEDALPFDVWIAVLQEYSTKVLKSQTSVDPSAVRRLAETRTLGRASAIYLAQIGALSSESRFSKTTMADLWCRREITPPVDASPLFSLCRAITKSLKLADE